MFTNDLQRVYDRLKPLAEKNRSNLKTAKIVVALFAIGYLVMVLIIPLINPYIPIFQNLSNSILVTICLVTWASLFLLVFSLLIRKSKKYRLTVDEWSIFLACSILKNLEQYSEAINNQNQDRAEEHKKMAVQDANNLLSTIEEGWEIGDFKLARNIFNETISKFKENLQTRLIPNLEKLDKKIFDKVESVSELSDSEISEKELWLTVLLL